MTLVSSGPGHGDETGHCVGVVCRDGHCGVEIPADPDPSADVRRQSAFVITQNGK
jgi:hypothetical protein